ncbi:MAG TPA: hypothetical protein VK666_14845 [Chryseolinea sp.]|nr:hypothetical protein [Chryseolinea sp.]
MDVIFGLMGWALAAALLVTILTRKDPKVKKVNYPQAGLPPEVDRRLEPDPYDFDIHNLK